MQLVQVRQVCSTAGPLVGRLSAWSTHIPHVHILTELAELDLRLVRGPLHRKCYPLLPWIDLAPLSSLQQLRQLTVHSSSYHPLPFGHAEHLTQLRSLSLVNVMPMPGLPPHLSQLLLRAAPYASAWIPTAASNAVQSFEGKLFSVALHMPIFANNPAKLRQVPSIRDAAEVQLDFDIFPDTVSTWCPYHFSQLAVLHLNIQAACFPFRPQWDLSTCNLLKFCLTVNCSLSPPDLRGLVHVFADNLQLHFTSVNSNHERCLLDCITWRIQQADVTSGGHAETYIPLCVTDAVGALMLSRYMTPSVTLNGLSFAQAAAQAAAAMMDDNIPMYFRRTELACSSAMDSASDSDDR